MVIGQIVALVMGCFMLWVGFTARKLGAQGLPYTVRRNRTTRALLGAFGALLVAVALLPLLPG